MKAKDTKQEIIGKALEGMPPSNAELRTTRLTRREMFAMAAMQGILANRWHTPDNLAQHAVDRADALLKELDK